MMPVAQRLRQKLLDLAIHGKLVPQDPKDEPAGELLARIRKARSVGGGKTQTSAAPLPIPEEEMPFDLPRGWVWCRLGEIFVMHAGKHISADEISSTQTDSCPYPCYGGNGVRGYVSRYNAKGPLAIVGRQGALCGNVQVACGCFYATEHAVIVDSVGGMEADFVGLFLTALNLNQYATATAQPGLSVAKICEEVLLPLPPLAEQKRIVEKLNAMLKETTRIAEDTERLTLLRKKARAKILDLAIRGKLVKQEKTDEPAAELLKRIAAEKAKLVAEKKIKKEKPLPPIAEDEIPFVLPKGWEWCRLAEIAYVAAGKTPAKTEFVEDGVPYIKMYNLRNQKIDFAFRKQFIKRETHDGKLAKSRLRPGDLLMNIVGPPLGKLAIIPDSISEANFNQAAVMIRPYVEAGIINQYLHYYLWQMDEINSIDTKGTAGQDNISITQSMMMRIALPPLAEQKRIVAKVKEMLAACDAFGGEG